MIIDEIKPYSFRYRVIIVLFVIDLFAWLLAGFSMYYIKYSREAMDIICLFSLITAGSGMTSVKNVKVSLQYLLACLAVIFIPILIYGDKVPGTSSQTGTLIHAKELYPLTS